MIIMVDLRGPLDNFREMVVTMVTVNYDLPTILNEIVTRFHRLDTWQQAITSYRYFITLEFKKNANNHYDMTDDALLLSEAVLGLATDVMSEMKNVAHLPIWSNSGEILVEYHGISHGQLLLKTFYETSETGFNKVNLELLADAYAKTVEEDLLSRIQNPVAYPHGVFDRVVSQTVVQPRQHHPIYPLNLTFDLDKFGDGLPC